MKEWLWPLVSTLITTNAYVPVLPGAPDAISRSTLIAKLRSIKKASQDRLSLKALHHRLWRRTHSCQDLAVLIVSNQHVPIAQCKGHIKPTNQIEDVRDVYNGCPLHPQKCLTMAWWSVPSTCHLRVGNTTVPPGRHHQPSCIASIEDINIRHHVNQLCTMASLGSKRLRPSASLRTLAIETEPSDPKLLPRYQPKLSSVLETLLLPRPF